MFTRIAGGARPLSPADGQDFEAALISALRPFVAEIRNRPRLTLPGPVRLGGFGAWLDHAINGAAAAVFLGKELRLEETLLEQLAHGMLLRDVAELLSPEALLDRPRSLTPQEQQVVQRHPQTAFDLLRELDWGDSPMRLVVLQHHERQDGMGYPHGLFGIHTVGRLLGQRFNRDIVFSLSESAGVADVFIALTADRPYRSALTARRVSLELTRMTRNTLSREVVNVLLRSWEPPRDEPSTIRSASNDSLLTLARPDFAAPTRSAEFDEVDRAS